jgi:hypothetical protein
LQVNEITKFPQLWGSVVPHKNDEEEEKEKAKEEEEKK